MYYTSQTFRGAEEKYPRAEKMAFALVNTTRQLRHYLQAHTIRVLTDQPFRMILYKPETSGKLVKWSIELNEFDIKYLPQGAVKGQVVADFITEYTYDMDVELVSKVTLQEKTNQKEWVVHVDGSSTSVTIGGRVLITLEKVKLEYAIKFRFKATNNEAEYESMIMGLRIARELGVKKVKVKTDFQLVVRKVQGEYA